MFVREPAELIGAFEKHCAVLMHITVSISYREMAEWVIIEIGRSALRELST